METERESQGSLRRTERKKKKERKGKEERKRKGKEERKRKEIPVALPAEGKSVDLLPLYARTSISKKKKVNIHPYLVF